MHKQAKALRYDYQPDLEKLKRPNRPLQTSGGIMFCGPNDWWTRDSAITASDFIASDPAYSEAVILFLAQNQGTAANKFSGEEHGKMPTEYREIYNNSRLGWAVKLGLSLTSGVLWKTGFKQYNTYYSYDTTPLFIKTTCEYAKLHPEILDKEITKKDGIKENVRQVVINSAKYIESTVSRDGLIHLKNHNLFGDLFRYWRDHPNSYFAEGGKLPNICKPMVILDIQALSAEALDNAASICGDQKTAQKWHSLARKVRRATIKNLWIGDDQYFAYGMHYGANGNYEQLKAVQANAGWLLNTNFFDDLTQTDRQKYITGIVSRLFSDELLTDAGIRCRSKNTIFDRKVQDYHGSWVTWPMESYMIAKGLRRQGLPRLADQIESRIVNAVNISGVAYEFFVVDSDNNVLFHPKKPKRPGDKPLYIEMNPEHSMAWTLSALASIHFSRQERSAQRSATHQQPWLHRLELDTLATIPFFPIRPTKKQFEKYVKNLKEPTIYINQSRGALLGGAKLVRQIGPDSLRELASRLF
jgi:glycogen debranching enzyme